MTTATTMKNIALQRVVLSPSAILSIDFMVNEVVHETPNEYCIKQDSDLGDALTIIQKDYHIKAGDELFLKLRVRHSKDIVTSEPIITIYRYTPDFYEDQDAFCDYYDLDYYDLVTSELQNHVDFLHLAVDRNGELVSRERWEQEQ